MRDFIKKRLSYMNAAEVLDKVFDIYKHSLFYQIGLNFCVSVIGGIAMYVIMLIAAFSGIMASVFINLSQVEANVPNIIIACGIGFAILIWFIITYSNLIIAATGFLSWQSFSGRPINFTAALKSTFKSLWRIATVSLAEMIAGIPVIALIAFILYSVFASQGVFTIEFWRYSHYLYFFRPLNILLLSAIILAGSLIVLVVYNYFALALPAAVFDRKHFFTAIITSYRLMKGDFCRILGIRVVFSGAVMIISYSFSSISGILIGVSNALSNSFSPNLYTLMIAGIVIQYIISLISSILIMPLSGILTSVIFFNQKIKKEGLDLAMQLEVLERTNGL